MGEGGGWAAVWPVLYLSTTGQKGLYSIEASVPGVTEIILATAPVFLTDHVNDYWRSIL